MWTLQLTVPDQPFYCHAVRHLLPAYFCFCSGNNLYEPSDSTFFLFFLLFPLMYCVCYLFLSYTDRTMQCEIGIQ